MKPLRIGIDFDNTIACYDGVFHKAAVEKKLIPSSVAPSKGAVRDYLRSIGKEDAWTELQGYIYGARMDLARPYPHVDRFLALCHNKQIATSIISHKTLTPFLGPKYDLHKAAKTWIDEQRFPWTPTAFFELTLEEKLKRISLQGCTVFIDDLPEVLAEKHFPPAVQKVLFDPNRLYSPTGDYFYATSWDEIIQALQL
ncbi:MAG TPA: hypothetical protein VLF94_01735 [Chlamydiales bacterium]|nr:hypothetical protein [Chlamydiales bacterium]